MGSELAGLRAAQDTAAAKLQKNVQKTAAVEDDVSSLRFSLFGSRRAAAAAAGEEGAAPGGGALGLLHAAGGSVMSRVEAIERRTESVAGARARRPPATPSHLFSPRRPHTPLPHTPPAPPPRCRPPSRPPARARRQRRSAARRATTRWTPWPPPWRTWGSRWRAAGRACGR